jgi:glycosyltransferase involved in cell wall biosynthesis
MVLDMNKNSEKKLISVIIPTCNRVNELNDLLNSFHNFGYFEDNSIEIIVVNNSTTEEPTKETCEKFDVKYLRQEIQCEGMAFNFGIMNSSGKYIVKTDDDVVIKSKDWLYKMYNHFQEDNSLGYLAGNVLEFPSKSLISNTWEKKVGSVKEIIVLF